MLGSHQADRSNAVGHTPSYLPEVNPGMTGGNTYTAASSEPTIQDYENIFGPSARDIKTDLQRFKRHGRWHLPDVLKGPNPWLTDRIDGLITDATNSPFTTKILPYLYKEDPDGKFTWNVWQFDEGMASRVPYESAARHLTQSKRSFEGYMVRHGMAIVLEHNFMMSPKGRENFKNQLNQLIGSIQYSNDFDVHMALVLAPSYQKTMREKYFTVEKTAGQICRDYCDLFGMLQKNVNALDILIEEAKAILKTWGGPMPDFLLCNSKLTFQLTMTPEKTNYITQGADGVKRLRQGPDISSYRGLSVIHSRAFSLEVGQQPRDILRRRVRTAEYYRILPHKDNVNREFEFYTEERDGWFTVTFQDLLRYAMYPGSPAAAAAFMMAGDRSGYGRDNHTRLEKVYSNIVNSKTVGAGGAMLGVTALGAGRNAREAVELDATEKNFVDDQRMFASNVTREGVIRPLLALFGESGQNRHSLETGKGGGKHEWGQFPESFDMGVSHITPTVDRFPVWGAWEDALRSGRIPEPVTAAMSCVPRLTPVMQETLFSRLRHVPLNHPFKPRTEAQPGSPDWYLAFTYYQEVYRRHGVCMGHLQIPTQVDMRARLVAASATRWSTNPIVNRRLRSVEVMSKLPSTKSNGNAAYVGDQILSQRGTLGSVNHECQFLPDKWFGNLAMRMTGGSGAAYTARSFILTAGILAPLLREYLVDGATLTGLEYIERYAVHTTKLTEDPGDDSRCGQILKNLMNMCLMYPGHILDFSLFYTIFVEDVLKVLLKDLKPKSPGEVAGVFLAKAGVSTWPMGTTTRSNLLHPRNKYLTGTLKDELLHATQASSGHLNLECLQLIRDHCHHEFSLLSTHHFFQPVLKHYRERGVHVRLSPSDTTTAEEWALFWATFRSRIYADPVVGENGVDCADTDFTANLQWRPFELMHDDGIEDLMDSQMDGDALAEANGWPTEMTGSHALDNVNVDLNSLFKKLRAPRRLVAPQPAAEDLAEQVEIVIVRPNIEHNMLGVIMGLAGSELGYTLWGQTELSCYDDSMHGIWGMSYKYHERAIVFNERNLVRLWDIAYDGYNGGKDDTYVDWMNPENPKTGLNVFRDATLDLSRSYRGPSMMVMAFVHDRNEVDSTGRSVFESHFRRNWPSPIVFHDMHNPARAAAPANETLPLDYENLQVLDVEDFRVFNNPLYSHSYAGYRSMMPAFHELHKMRKSAGQASADSETHTDSLAFQGSMRVKQRGSILQDIQGSGHHGPDYVGVASVRAGKGIKYNGMAPALTHMV